MVQNKLFPKILKTVGVLFFWLLLWSLAAYTISDNLKLFLPGPAAVLQKWLQLGLTGSYWQAVFATLLRIAAGFIFGFLFGFLFGLLTAEYKIADAVMAPAFRVIRSVPVVSFIILAFLFIDVDRLPIFISFLMVVPLVWQCVRDALNHSDRKLNELCAVYGLSRKRQLWLVQLPQIFPALLSTAANALGLAWKAGVAAEVLCTPAVSLGHRIYVSKASLNFDEVYAVTLTVVLLSLFIEFFLKFLCRKYTSGKGGAR